MDLPAPFSKALDNEAVLAYRLQYQRFRHGDARGATGETPLPIVAMHLPDEDNDDYDHAEEDEKAVFKEIAQYRMNYRAHRCGAHHGAKGEVTTLAGKMGMRHAMMLPVSQLVSLARFRAAAALEAVESTFHVHLGAGKLGLGLAVPAIHATRLQSYAILQRRSAAWAPLVGAPDNDPAANSSKTIDIRVNGEPIAAGLTLVTKSEDILDAADGGCPRMFVCTEDVGVLRTLVGRAQTFSTALGPALGDTTQQLLKGVPPRAAGHRPCLYACENDHKAVEALAEALEGRVDVVNCMVDRICAERKISNEGVDVEAEPYRGEIVVITPPAHAPAPPFTGNGVRVPRLQAEASYFCQRKIIMVNGMHTTLAFLTLLEKEPAGLQGDTWKEHALLVPEAASQDVQHMVCLWAVARCLYIFWEHEPEIIKQAHGLSSDDAVCDELLGYARATLGRYGTVKDKLGRVLGGGVANRWEGRLKMIQNFLEGEPSMRGIRRRLLQKAGVSEQELRSAVATLVADTQRFVGVRVKRQSFVSG